MFLFSVYVCVHVFVDTVPAEWFSGASDQRPHHLLHPTGPTATRRRPAPTPLLLLHLTTHRDERERLIRETEGIKSRKNMQGEKGRESFLVWCCVGHSTWYHNYVPDRHIDFIMFILQRLSLALDTMNNQICEQGRGRRASEGYSTLHEQDETRHTQQDVTHGTTRLIGYIGHAKMLAVPL